jgi:tetratricopeptide (TPR) repeat protein
MSTKTTKPEQEQADIDLGQAYSRAELFLEKNKQAVTYGVVGLLVVVGGLLGYRKLYAEPRAKEANDLIWKAQYYFEIDSLDKAINGDGNYFGFQYIADEYGNTPAGDLARFYLGTCYLQKGEYETAVSYYEDADVEDVVLKAMAAGGIGDAYVELGREQDAMKQFEKAASITTNDFTTPMYLMKAGILYQQAGDWKKAAKAFRRVANDFPTNPDANTAKKYAARAEAMAG